MDFDNWHCCDCALWKDSVASGRLSPKTAKVYQARIAEHERQARELALPIDWDRFYRNPPLYGLDMRDRLYLRPSA
jgi:hypothetical protein